MKCKHHQSVMHFSLMTTEVDTTLQHPLAMATVNMPTGIVCSKEGITISLQPPALFCIGGEGVPCVLGVMRNRSSGVTLENVLAHLPKRQEEHLHRQELFCKN